MDFLRTAMEIGICETIACVDEVQSERLSLEASNYLPHVSRSEASARIGRIAEALCGTGASQLLLLGPELALLEALAELGYSGTIYVCLPRELDRQSKQRIGYNVPPSIKVRFMDEGEFPPHFLPSTSAVVAFGFGDSDTAFLPGFQRRQVEYYHSFSGAVFLACIAHQEQGERPLGWYAESTSATFTAIVY